MRFTIGVVSGLTLFGVACGGSDDDPGDDSGNGGSAAAAGASPAGGNVSAGGNEGSEAGASAMGGGASSSGAAGMGAGGAGQAGAPDGECVTPGQECSEAGACCSYSTCIVEPDTNATLCAANCTDHAECQSGCCAPLRNGMTSVCGPAIFCEPPPEPPPPPTGCGTLVLLADDGQFLGVATGNEFATDGVCNRFSAYGSDFAANGIFNQFSQYGSQFSQLSAYNQFTSTPPFLFCDGSGEAIAFVTKNGLLSPRVDPDQLCAALRQAGF